MSRTFSAASQPEPELIERYLGVIGRQITGRLRLMEVCGTHTMAIFESGLRPRLTELGVELLSGPGCPVCVTAQEDIDYILHIAAAPEVILCTFGDMLRVPGSTTSLTELRAEGADVRVVYSPADSLMVAGENPGRRVVFLAVGFETTAPAIAATLSQATAVGLSNFFVYPCHKTIPGPMIELACHPELNLDGFLCPGHVSVIIGAQAYEPVVERGGKPCVVGGFSPLELLAAIQALATQVGQGEARVENMYPAVVSTAGNRIAQQLIDKVFDPADVRWRGLGLLPQSGLELSAEYLSRDIRRLYPHFKPPPPDQRLAACRCGEVLIGKIQPHECAAFGSSCTPDTPLGPCMVSLEGSCQAHYRYRSIGGVSNG